MTLTWWTVVGFAVAAVVGAAWEWLLRREVRSHE
jgi:hypothetical protein